VRRSKHSKNEVVEPKKEEEEEEEISCDHSLNQMFKMDMTEC
jgi:hypothetical protein